MRTENEASAGRFRFFNELLEMGIGLTTLYMVATGNKHVLEAKTKEDERQAAKEQLPHIFGWGKADERIWAELMVPLGIKKNLTLTSLLSVMTNEEVKGFRIEITGMKAQMEVGDEKNRNNIEFTNQDIRVRFLNEIVAMIEDKGPRAVVHILRTHQLIGGNPSGEKIKIFAAKFLGLADIDDLADPAKLASKIDAWTNEIEEFRKERKTERQKASFFGRWKVRKQSLFNAVMSKMKLKGVSK